MPRKPLNPKIVVLGVLACLASKAAVADSTNVGDGLLAGIQKSPQGVTLRTKTGVFRLDVCTPKIIHVLFSKDGVFPEQRVPVVIGRFAPTPFQMSVGATSLKISTTALVAEIDRATGAVVFRDTKGATILGESPDGRSLTPTMLDGTPPEASNKSAQRFSLPAGEGIYGLGQHQDRLGAAGAFSSLDYRGTIVPLEQDYITNLAIPFLVSSRGYGVFWNNPSPSTVEVGVGQESAVPAAQLLSEDGRSGGLTGRYYSGENFDTLVSTQIDPKIDFVWDAPPPGLPHDHYSVRWTGSIVAQKGGDYRLVATTDDGVRLWIDDKQVINDWHSRAAKPDTVTLHFDANSRHKIRMEYYQNLYNASARLAWSPPTEKSEVAWSSEAADTIDYYFFYGPSIDSVIAGYRRTTGQVPMPPKWALGFWQSRERYSTQQEWLDIAGEYRKRQEPIDNIVQDWLYWTPEPWGSHAFDPKRYPDPAAAIKTLHDVDHMHFMISVWGKFAPGNRGHPDANYDLLAAKGFLYPPLGDPRLQERFYDAFNPAARALYWSLMRDQILAKGVDAWWLDASEPEVDLKQFRKQPTAAGLASRVMNAWPLMHTKGVYEGQRAVKPDTRAMILTRSGYAGEQRNATTIWSSDITAGWDVFSHQITEGLEMSLSGFPWWTTDTGGFFVNYPGGSAYPEYRELFTRWFEWSAFCPVFRVHGTSTQKEMWRFGPEYESILVRYDNLRYRLLPYTYSQAWQVTHNASTLMRALVMDFPEEAKARELSDEYLFGPAFLVCPVTAKGATARSVYLPGNADWTDFWTGERLKGGTTINANAPIGTLPLYVRAGSIIPMGPFLQYTAEKPEDPIELRVYRGANGSFTLHEDDGTTYGYERGAYTAIPISWDEASQTLTIGNRSGSFPGMLAKRTFRIVWVTMRHGAGLDPEANADIVIIYNGKTMNVK